MELGPAAPTPPIALAGGAAAASARRLGSHVGVTDAVLASLRDVCAVVDDDAASTAEASRDWWPLAMTWALQGQVASRAAVVARPADAEQVAAVLTICNRVGIPVTAAGGRSGVCGASVPVHGGVVLDLCALSGIRSVDDVSLTVDVAPGTFGDHFEHELRTEHGLTCGHFPQSMALSTVGGWIACRGAGQLSTRYGKIEDMVVGLDVVLADGRTLSTGGFPATATGPDLTQLFVGSEGTLGVITGARLRVHPAPTYERRGVWSMPSFAAGLDLCRRLIRRGATPAVLRLYDGVESDRNYAVGTDRNVVIVIDEGDRHVVDAVFAIVEEEMSGAGGGVGGERLDDALAEHWLAKRNDVAALERLITDGLVVDTMEVSGPWSVLPRAYDAALRAIDAVDGNLAVSAHCSHSYLDGGCLYFTFAGKPPERDAQDRPTQEGIERYYRAVWDAGTRAVLDAGGSLSHHHGVGINRGRYMGEALGLGAELVAQLKATLDPQGILNPGKLGIASRFGPVGLP
jgi:alkyldihydroxyacetonephosphate synthase